MTTLREAAEAALEALVDAQLHSYALKHSETDRLITALRAVAEPKHKPHCALLQIPSRDCDCGAEPTVPSDCADSHQPVAWVCYGSSSDEKHAIDYQQEDIDAVPVGTMLYTAPPQRKPTITDLQEALADVALIDRAALDDAEEFDGGATLAQIDEVHRKLFGGQDE